MRQAERIGECHACSKRGMKWALEWNGLNWTGLAGTDRNWRDVPARCTAGEVVGLRKRDAGLIPMERRIGEEVCWAGRKKTFR